MPKVLTPAGEVVELEREPRTDYERNLRQFLKQASESELAGLAGALALRFFELGISGSGVLFSAHCELAQRARKLDQV